MTTPRTACKDFWLGYVIELFPINFENVYSIEAAVNALSSFHSSSKAIKHKLVNVVMNKLHELCRVCRLLYPEFFGGVTAITGEHFEKLNGFPNNYYGWGGEDDELWYRLVN